MVHHATTAAFTLSTDRAQLTTYCSCDICWVLGYLLLPRQPFIHSCWLSFRHSLKLCSPFSQVAKSQSCFNLWRISHFFPLHCSPPSATTIQITMSKQPSSRNHRGKRLRPEQCLQLFLLVAVGIWLVYQLGHSYRRRAVAVEGELMRRCWMDRKSLVKFAGLVSGEISGGDIVAREDGAVEREPRANKGREDEGDEDDDGLFGYDDGDDRNFHPENGEGGEENELDRSPVRMVNTTSGAQHDVAGAADGTDMVTERT